MINSYLKVHVSVCIGFKDKLQHEPRVSNGNRWSPFILHFVFCFICYLLSLTFSALNWQTFSSIISMSTLGWNILEIKTDLKVWLCFIAALLKDKGFLSVICKSVSPGLRRRQGRTRRASVRENLSPPLCLFFSWMIWKLPPEHYGRL